MFPILTLPRACGREVTHNGKRGQLDAYQGTIRQSTADQLTDVTTT